MADFLQPIPENDLTEDDELVRAYWKRFADACHRGDAPALDTLREEIEAEDFELPEEENARAEITLIRGECMSIVARWKGDAAGAERGFRLMRRACEQIRSLRIKTKAHIQYRVGNAHIRVGYLKRDKEEIIKGLVGLDNAWLRLHFVRPVKEGEEDEIRARRRTIMTDLGEAYIAQIYYDQNAELAGDSIRCFQDAIAWGDKSKRDFRAESGLALAQILHVTMTEVRRKRAEYEPEPNLCEQAAKRVRELSTELQALSKKKALEFDHARPCTYIGRAARELFIATKNPEWLEIGEEVLGFAIGLYRIKYHGFRRALTEVALARLLERRARFLEEKKLLTQSDKSRSAAAWRYDRARKMFSVFWNDRVLNCTDRIESLDDDDLTMDDIFGIRVAQTQQQYEGKVTHESAKKFNEEATKYRSMRGLRERIGPVIPPATESDLLELEEILTHVRDVQRSGGVYDPPEGLAAFTDWVTICLKSHGLAIPLGDTEARGVGVDGRSVVFLPRTGGTRSMRGIDPIKVETDPKNPTPGDTARSLLDFRGR